jgi:rsbT co-antagonist protein RsbR
MHNQVDRLDGSRLRFNNHSIDRRREFVGLGPSDGPKIASVRDLISGNAAKFVASFFDSLEAIPEAAGLFSRRSTLEEAKRLKHEHITAMTQGNYGPDYFEQRAKLAHIYSGVGLDVCIFLGAFHQLMRVVGTEIMQNSKLPPLEAFEAFVSLKKVAFLDIGIMVDVLVDERERVISAQQDALRELSTPVLQLRDRLLVLPIIGMIDTLRARQLTDGLLVAIRDNRAKVVVMDVTGVAAVDSKVANHLIQTVAAARLMGALVILTGLSAEVAQSLVAIGVDLARINTIGDLQGGLEEAERLLGYKVVSIESMQRLPEPG